MRDYSLQVSSDLLLWVAFDPKYVYDLVESSWDNHVAYGRLGRRNKDLACDPVYCDIVLTCQFSVLHWPMLWVCDHTFVRYSYVGA